MTVLTRFFENIGSVVLLATRAFSHLPSIGRQTARVIEQCHMIGYTTLPIVTILSFFIGGVLALQSGISLQDFGARQFIGTLVGESMARELGPVMAAILLAGRVGSAITAELASMKVYQEVDALVTMNIRPERILVLPRIVAVLLMMPILAIVAVVIGWLGGAVVCQYVTMIGVDWDLYFQSLKEFLTVKDVLGGLIKAEIFGIGVVLVACNTGLRTRGGPREIGLSVTQAVVQSLILILVMDYFITRALI
ncbi:MAG TPA: ABC transporter permease [Opitutaceae bacterium]|nr:ABC transporter permease [Opitutaceae bacterium]